jgi:hypothetical protein
MTRAAFKDTINILVQKMETELNLPWKVYLIKDIFIEVLSPPPPAFAYLVCASVSVSPVAYPACDSGQQYGIGDASPDPIPFQ